jgi:hypothetical protein
MDEQDHDEDMEETSDWIPDRFILSEEELDQKTYEAFLNHAPDPESITDTESLLQESHRLFVKETPLQEKKDLLVELAQHGVVKVYRLIEKYSKQPDPELEQWSKIALYECRMALEEDLMEENIGIISTGLGGQGNCFRYIVVLALLSPPLSKDQQSMIRSVLDDICSQHDSLTEELQFLPSYLSIKALISMDIPVATVVEECIDSINQDKDLVYPDYLVTNVEVPTEEDIQAFLKELED